MKPLSVLFLISAIRGGFASIDCGFREADYCHLCQDDNQGNRRNWCQGDCVFKNGYCGPEGGVSCGDHDADSCFQCGSGSNYCNGDCHWVNNVCKPKPEEQVTCGFDFKADWCEECPTDQLAEYGYYWCEGNCMWDEYDNCVPKRIQIRDGVRFHVI